MAQLEQVTEKVTLMNDDMQNINNPTQLDIKEVASRPATPSLEEVDTQKTNAVSKVTSAAVLS